MITTDCIEVEMFDGRLVNVGRLRFDDHEFCLHLVRRAFVVATWSMDYTEQIEDIEVEELYCDLLGIECETNELDFFYADLAIASEIVKHGGFVILDEGPLCGY